MNQAASSGFLRAPSNMADAETESHAETDYALARAAAEGGMDAFGELYARHSRWVFNLCLRMTTEAQVSEDITQEVFMHLFRQIGSFRGESLFTTWLHRITVNYVLMYFRHRGVQLDKTTDDGELPEQAVRGTENPWRMREVERIALEEAVTQLPPGSRSVFVLHDVEGHKHDEVARLLGCATGTSKSQLHKARKKLRWLLLRPTGCDAKENGNVEVSAVDVAPRSYSPTHRRLRRAK